MIKFYLIKEELLQFSNLKTIDLIKSQLTDAGINALAENGDKFFNLQTIYQG